MNKRITTFTGIVLLLIWLVWWGVSIHRGDLLWAAQSSIHIPAFGIDFSLHTETPTRIWLTGENPYADKELLFSYPPIVPRLFSWVYFFTPRQALNIWIVTLGVIALTSATMANGWRKDIGLNSFSSYWVASLFVFSAPVIFAMERSNYDMLIIPLVIFGVTLSNSKSETLPVFGGLLLGLAIWAKLYPIFIIFGLFVTRKYSATFWSIFWVGLIGLSDVAEMYQFHLNTNIHVDKAKYVAGLGGFYPCTWNHSFSLSWPSFWKDTPLIHINGNVGASVVILGMIWWVSNMIRRVAVPVTMLTSYLLWIIAAATFLPPVSNDYNLAPLPLAFLANWQGKSKLNYLTLLCMVLWCEPVGFPANANIMLLAKLGALAGTGWLIIQNCRCLRAAK